MADERKDRPAAENANKADVGASMSPTEQEVPTEAGAVDKEAGEEDRRKAVLMWAEGWLSAERLTPYLEACGSDVDKALDLYRWNVLLGQFLVRDISYFEVALRNAYNDTMGSRWDGDEHWLLDDGSPVRRPVVRKSGKGSSDVNRVNRIIIDKAVAGLPDGFTSGDLVAGLTLGFWVHLTDRSREAVIWRTGLYTAWPKGTNRAELQDCLDGILRVRNRIAHSERLFDPKRPQLSPRKADADAVRLLGQLQPEAAEYLRRAEDMTLDRFLEEHPVPANVEL